jgi:hypothetical protein
MELSSSVHIEERFSSEFFGMRSFGAKEGE